MTLLPISIVLILSGTFIKMEINSFISSNNYLIGFESWFQHLWVPFFEKKDVIITNEILKFLYATNENIDKYQQFLILNDIKFKAIKYYNSILDDFPYLEDEIEKEWVALTIDDFKESLSFMNISSRKSLVRYINQLEKIILDYSLYLSEQKHIFQVVVDKTIKYKVKESKQVFFIITSKFYATQNIFKIGGLDDISLIEKRNDFYYVALFLTYDYKLVKHFLSSLLSTFRLFNSDLYKLNFKDLLRIVEEFIDKINGYLSHFNYIQPTLISNLYKIETIKENMEIQNIGTAV